MDNYEFINTSLRIANDIPTKYELGGWGNQKDGYYLFDCVCLIKSILWGFNFSVGGHGGAIYLANGVPDVGANRMIELCSNISSDFKNINIGEILWLDGHVGIYVGNRRVVEATVAWESKVLISEVLEDGTRVRNNHRVYKWVKHGYLPYIKYNAPFATITHFSITDITSRSVKIVYDTNLPIDEALYSLDNKNYILIPNDNVITDLTPNIEYKITIKVRRKYTDNFTESNVINFKTLDQPITLKYKKGDNVIVKGDIYILPTSNQLITKVNNYVGVITDIDNHYGSINPYKINNIGWVSESSIRLYQKNNIFKIIIDFFKLILAYILLPFSIVFILLTFISFFIV